MATKTSNKDSTSCNETSSKKPQRQGQQHQQKTPNKHVCFAVKLCNGHNRRDCTIDRPHWDRKKPLHCHFPYLVRLCKTFYRTTRSCTPRKIQQTLTSPQATTASILPTSDRHVDIAKACDNQADPFSGIRHNYCNGKTGTNAHPEAFQQPFKLQ